MSVPRISSMHAWLFIALCISVTVLVHTVFAGDAVVSRTKNLQQTPTQYGNSDVTRYSNLLALPLSPNNADTIRYENLQCTQLQPQNADIIRYGNLQSLKLEPNDADMIRYKNLASLPMDQILGYDVNITSLVTTDQNRNPQSNFLPGEIVQINATLKNIGNYPLSAGIVSVMVFDPTTTSLLLTYSLEDIAVQQTTQVILGYRLPSNSQPGTYTVKSSVFTDWPSNGGIMLDVETIAFAVS